MKPSHNIAPPLAGPTGVTNETQPHIALLLDGRAAHRMLSIGQRKLWELTKCDAIPSKRIGRRVLYCPLELAAWIRIGCPATPGAARRVRKEVCS